VSSLLTIGYEGAAVEDVVGTLKAAGVQVLIDVRELPLSRKKGFSKKALAAVLEADGIDYLHLRDLGNPKAGREAAKRGEGTAFRRIFGVQLASEPAQAALMQAIDIAVQSRTCLLCFERDPASCHRSMVADEMARRHAFQVHHLRAARP